MWVRVSVDFTTLTGIRSQREGTYDVLDASKTPWTENVDYYKTAFNMDERLERWYWYTNFLDASYVTNWEGYVYWVGTTLVWCQD